MKYPDTQFLRAIAILLILNSHMDQYYPIPYLATGGAIGNSIFFFLSAFGVCLSEQNSNKPFKEWYSDRIGRIYPSLWAVLLIIKLPIMISYGRLSSDSVLTFIGYFFSPPYWFLLVLLVYYLLTFPFLKEVRNNLMFTTFFVLSLTYLVCYVTLVDLTKWSIEENPIYLIHYFMVFIFGIYIAKKK